ncbi:hypothetical protein S83_051644 [Arachis hypogaea]
MLVKLFQRIIDASISYLSKIKRTLWEAAFRRSAIGFKLDSLLKLTDTRASKNKMTLMHYHCKVLADRSPGLLDFHLDLVSLEAATKVMIYAWLEKENPCQALNLFQEGKVSGKDNTKTNETKDDAGKDGTGAKNDTRSDAQAAEKSEREKSNPVKKKDGENSTPTKAAEPPPENEFEKRIRPKVIPASEIGVAFL